MHRGALVVCCVIAFVASVHRNASADDVKKDVQSIVDLSWQVTDTILARHVDPPSRQQLFLCGLRAAARRADVGAGRDWARKLSDASGSALRTTLAELLKPLLGKAAKDELQEHFLNGMFSNLKGRAQFIPGGSYRVQKQLAQNQYVGLGVQLANNKGAHIFARVFPRGPAKKAGVIDGDQVLEVDGVSTEGRTTGKVVEMLRGLRDTDVEIVVRQPGKKKRKYKITRHVVPIDTVVGSKRVSDDEWDFSSSDKRFAMVKFLQVNGSTTAEWRRAARRIKRAGFEGVVLDFRQTQSADFHQTVLLADALIDRAAVGNVVRVGAKREVQTRPGATLPRVPMVVLTSSRTPDSLRWLADALKKNRYATILGRDNRMQRMRYETVELPHDLGAIRLLTGVLTAPGVKAILDPVPVTGVDLHGPQVAKRALSKAAEKAADGFKNLRRFVVPTDKQALETLRRKIAKLERTAS